MADEERRHPILHPFDDELFAAMAADAGISREDVPEDIDPSLEWGNDHITTDLEGMTTFSFFAGDDSYLGRLWMNVDEMAGIVYEHSGGIRRIGVPMRFPDTVAGAMVGGPLSRVVELRHLEHAVVTAIQDDEDEGSWLTISKAAG